MKHTQWGIGVSCWLLGGTLVAGLVVGGLAGTGKAHAADFAYAGDAGPGFWAQLDPARGAGSRRSTSAR
jgi:hypothetical protein